jgi:hypothetical protein
MGTEQPEENMYGTSCAIPIKSNILEMRASGLPQARYARLSGAANHPSGARPSKCIIIIIESFHALLRASRKRTK